jgi:hypothetical protein
MRTTLAIDDDVLAAARELAVMEKKSVGEVISQLSRKGLSPAVSPGKIRNGIPLLPFDPAKPRVTSEHVKQLLEELP